jgi:hypothetical protein
MIKLVCLAILGTIGAFAQTTSQDTSPSRRDAYRNAYRAWREADPSIERDAVTAGAGVVSLRAARLTGVQSQYAAQRGYFLEGLIATAGETLSWLEDARAVEPSMAPPKGLDDYLTTGDAAVRRGLETFAKDTDRGIKPLQQALQREQQALADLTTAVDAERKAAEAYVDAESGTEQTILQTTVEDRILVAAIRQTLDDTSQEAAAWADYYRKLAGDRH